MGNRSDNFNRSDNSTSLGTPSDGGSAWVAARGVLAIASNRAQAAPTGSGDRVAYLATGDVDADVQATLFSTGAGLSFWVQDGNNYWLVGSGSNYIAIYRFSGGSTYTQFGGGNITGFADGDVVKVTTRSGVVTVYRNGTQIAQFTDTANLFRTGNHGVWFNTATSAVDNWSGGSAWSFSVDRTGLLSGSFGTVTLTLTGSSTSWTGSPFSLSTAPTGWSIASQSVVSGTSATVTLNRGSGTGTLTITDGQFSASLTAGTTSTTIVAGTWTAAGTWDTGEPPTATVNARGVVAHAVTGASGTVGDSPAAGTAVLTVNSGGSVRVDSGNTLIVRGRLSNAGTVTVGQNTGGATLKFDASASAAPSSTHYDYYGNAAAASFVTRGNSSSHSVVTSAATGATAFFAGALNSGTLDCEWCDFSAIDDGATNGITYFVNTNPASVAVSAKFWDCSFTNCGSVAPGLTLPANAGFSMRRCKWSGTTGTGCVGITAVAPSAGVVRELGILNSTADGNGFDKGVGWSEVGVTAIWGNVLDSDSGGSTNTGAWPAGAIGCNFLRITQTSGGGLSGVAVRGDIKDLYLLADGGTDNPHILLPRDTGAAQMIDGAVVEYTSTITADGGNWFYGTGTWTLIRCIQLPTVNAGSAGAVGAITPLNGSTFHVVHCTLHSPHYNGGILIGDTSVAVGELAEVRDCIFWVPSGVSGTAITAVGSGISTTDVATPSGIHHNAHINIGATKYEGSYSVAPGANDITISAASLPFVDVNRNLATWAVTKGSASGTYAGQLADGRGYLKADPTLIAGLLAYVRGGQVPTWAALRNAGSDGVTVGAFDLPPANVLLRRRRAVLA